MDTTTIFLFVVFGCLGAALGALLQRAQDRRSAPPAPPQVSPASMSEEKVAPALPPVEKKLASDGDVEIMRAWRSETGQLWLEMNGKRFATRDAIQPDERQRILNLVVELRPWLDTSASKPASSRLPQAQPGAAQPAKVVTGKEKVPPPQISLKSIVEQIDDVLQSNLISSPFKDRDIRLTEGPGGGVVVLIDSKKYVGIDAVPDADIQAFIRKAVAEWEKIAH
jgi:hypothetical protein